MKIITIMIDIVGEDIKMVISVLINHIDIGKTVKTE